MDEPAHYEIRVAEQFDGCIAAWFDGMKLVNDAVFDGTILRGAVIDQPALFGLLGKIRDLGLTLISVQRISNLQSE